MQYNVYLIKIPKVNSLYPKFTTLLYVYAHPYMYVFLLSKKCCGVREFDASSKICVSFVS